MVIIFVFGKFPGGLGTYIKVGSTYIERFYHHFFESDSEIIKLAEELKIRNRLKFYSARTGILRKNVIYPFTNPFHLLRFQPLSFIDRLRCGLAVGIFKYIPFPIPYLDKISASNWIKKFGGESVYKEIWGPLLEGKFSRYASHVPALWLWGRIYDRSPKLGYFDGSVKILFDKMIQHISKKGGRILLNAEVIKITKKKDKIIVSEKKHNYEFDKVIVTTVSPIAEKLLQDTMSKQYRKSLSSQDQLGAICVLVELKHPIQSQYWVSICEDRAEVLVMVEHTNMIDKKYYNGRHLVYLANYIHRDDIRFKKSDEEIKKEYISFLKTINKDFKKSWIYKIHLSKVPRAQTIFKLHSLDQIPSIQTEIKNVYMVNIDQMYPHDRNLNQGVQLGYKAAEMSME